MRYATLVLIIALGFLVVFVVVEALHLPLLTDPSGVLRTATPLAAFAGVGLLVADVLLPVPSSLVMIAHGALFGVVLGALLSLAGSVGAAVAGYWLGRRGRGFAAGVTDGVSRERAERLLARYGLTAIVLTRPIPLLAETTVILAGASGRLSPAAVALAAAAGAAPIALVYAVAGAFAASFAHGAVIFLLVVTISAIFAWSASRRPEPKPETRASPRHEPLVAK